MCMYTHTETHTYVYMYKIDHANTERLLHDGPEIDKELTIYGKTYNPGILTGQMFTLYAGK